MQGADYDGYAVSFHASSSELEFWRRRDTRQVSRNPWIT